MIDQPVAPDPPGSLGPGPIVIVGGGIAGLATAYECVRRGVRPVVLEAGPRPGGVILTESVDGFLIDAGPDALIAQKPGAIELIRELGLGDRIQTTLEPRTSFILRGGRLHALPEASVMGIPTRLLPLATTSLFSWPGKLRMAADLVLPRRANGEDESIGAFMRRRFGDEAVDYLAQPLLAGIHSGDVERLSMRKLFPRLVELETRHRSLILAFRRAPARPSPDGIFRSLPGGLEELVRAVMAALPPATVRARSRVEALARGDGGTWRLSLAGGGALEARRVVLCVPAYAAQALLAGVDPALAELAGEIGYVSSATVALGYRREQVRHPLAGAGFVVPAAERQCSLMAASFVSSKWPGRAPPGMVLLRAFIGGARNPELMALDLDALASLAERELGGLLGIEGAPVLVRAYRWDRSNAQHEVGHLTRLARIDERLGQLPGLYITGSGFRVTGITDCITDGRATAAAALT